MKWENWQINSALNIKIKLFKTFSIVQKINFENLKVI